MQADRLAQVSAVLANTGDTPVLQRLLEASADMLDSDGAGVAVIHDGEHQRAVALSHGALAGVDELQFTLGEGPCIDADRSRKPVLEGDLRSCGSRWPAFVPEAIALGVLAVFSFPMRVGSIRMGVYSLYRSRTESLTDIDVQDAQAISHLATQLLLDLEDGLDSEALPTQLADVVDKRREVHQATGMIAAQLNVTPADALARLRAFSWAQSRSIQDVSVEVVGGLIRFSPE